MPPTSKLEARLAKLKAEGAGENGVAVRVAVRSFFSRAPCEDLVVSFVY